MMFQSTLDCDLLSCVIPNTVTRSSNFDVNNDPWIVAPAETFNLSSEVHPSNNLTTKQTTFTAVLESTTSTNMSSHGESNIKLTVEKLIYYSSKK